MRHRLFVGSTALLGMLAVLFLAGGPAAGQGRWPEETPKLPMAKTWVDWLQVVQGRGACCAITSW